MTASSKEYSLHVELKGQSNLARTPEERSLFAKGATEPRATATPTRGSRVTAKEGTPPSPNRIQGMVSVARAELATAPPAPGVLCCGFAPSPAHAKQQLSKNYIKNHVPAGGTGTAEVRCDDGIVTMGSVSFPALSSFSPMLFRCIQHPGPWSWILIILTIPHPHKCRCIIHRDTQVCMYFPVEEIWYLCFIRWTRRTENQEFWAITQTTQLWNQRCTEKKHNKKATYASFQEKYLSFPICLRLMSTHKRLKSGLDENIQYNNILRI